VISVDLSTQLGLNNGTAWVGFTASTGGYTESSDILSWTFAPANVPTPITQTLTPSPQPVQTNFVPSARPASQVQISATRSA
jgi:hypothetical protein